MRLNTYPSNPFPPSTDRMDADALETEVSKLKSGLTNVQDDFTDVIGWDNHKNLIPMTVDGIKAFVTGWDGNSLTSAGITFTILTDEYENVIGIRVNGTSTYSVNLSIYEYTNADILSLNGFILNGNTIGSDVSLQIVPSDFATYIAKDDGNGSVISYSGDKAASVRISITAGKTVDGVILPMVSKEGGAFQPYHPVLGPAVVDHESRIEAVESGLDTVKSGLIKVTKNDGGISVDISEYTSSNPYSVTHDGYVVVSSERSTSGVIQVFTEGANNLFLGGIGMNVTGLYQIESMYVREGMRVYVNSNTASGSSVSFIPII